MENIMMPFLKILEWSKNNYMRFGEFEFTFFQFYTFCMIAIVACKFVQGVLYK